MSYKVKLVFFVWLRSVRFVNSRRFPERDEKKFLTNLWHAWSKTSMHALNIRAFCLQCWTVLCLLPLWQCRYN